MRNAFVVTFPQNWLQKPNVLLYSATPDVSYRIERLKKGLVFLSIRELLHYADYLSKLRPNNVKGIMIIVELCDRME